MVRRPMRFPDIPEGASESEVMMCWVNWLRDFVIEVWSRSEDPVLLVLRLHAYCENAMRLIVTAYLPHGDTYFQERQPNFSHLLSLVRATATVPERVARALGRLNDLRNDCAHDPTFAIPDDAFARIAGDLGPFKNPAFDLPSGEPHTVIAGIPVLVSILSVLTVAAARDPSSARSHIRSEAEWLEVLGLENQQPGRDG